jgi:DNA-binding transcriptional LysR family regulator
MRRIASGAGVKSIARPLRLGSVTSAFSELLPSIIPKFKDANPGVTVLLESIEHADQIHRLKRGELDIGILRTGGEDIPDLDLAPIEEQPFVAVLPEGHRLAQQDEIAISELSDEDLICMPRHRSPEYVDAILGSCRAAGFSPRLAFEPTDDQVLLGLVACGLGIGMVPCCVANLQLPGTVYRPLAEPAPTTVLCFAQATSRPSRYFEDLRALAGDVPAGAGLQPTLAPRRVQRAETAELPPT